MNESIHRFWNEDGVGFDHPGYALTRCALCNAVFIAGKADDSATCGRHHEPPAERPTPEPAADQAPNIDEYRGNET